MEKSPPHNSLDDILASPAEKNLNPIHSEVSSSSSSVARTTHRIFSVLSTSKPCSVRRFGCLRNANLGGVCNEFSVGYFRGVSDDPVPDSRSWILTTESAFKNLVADATANSTAPWDVGIHYNQRRTLALYVAYSSPKRASR